MNPLYRQAIVQSVFGTALFIALIFLPAGTFHYWQGWLFFAVFATATTGFTIYPAIYDKPLLERRLKAGPQHEQAWSQKIIVSLAFVAFFAIIGLPALDHRFGWSPVAPWVSILGDVIILLSFLFMFWVIKANSFSASNIRVEEGQQVIDTGPYAYVRHPMYAGASWLLVGIPLTLGSWWSLGLIALFMPVLLWRLLDEEKILRKDLRGYTEYMQKVAIASFHSSGSSYGAHFFEPHRVVCTPAIGHARRRGPFRPAPDIIPLGKLIRTKQTIQTADIAATQPYAERGPALVDAVELGGVRTTVAVPMLKNNDLVAAIVIFRQEV